MMSSILKEITYSAPGKATTRRLSHSTLVKHLSQSGMPNPRSHSQDRQNRRRIMKARPLHGILDQANAEVGLCPGRLRTAGSGSAAQCAMASATGYGGQLLL